MDVEDERVLLRRVEIGRIGDDAVLIEAVVLPGDDIRAADLPLADKVIEVRQLPRLRIERGEDVQLARSAFESSPPVTSIALE